MPRKDAAGRIASDRVAAESAAMATVAGGMVIGGFYPDLAGAIERPAELQPSRPATATASERDERGGGESDSASPPALLPQAEAAIPGRSLDVPLDMPSAVSAPDGREPIRGSEAEFGRNDGLSRAADAADARPPGAGGDPQAAGAGATASGATWSGSAALATVQDEHVDSVASGSVTALGSSTGVVPGLTTLPDVRADPVGPGAADAVLATPANTAADALAPAHGLPATVTDAGGTVAEAALSGGSAAVSTLGGQAVQAVDSLAASAEAVQLPVHEIVAGATDLALDALTPAVGAAAIADDAPRSLGDVASEAPAALAPAGDGASGAASDLASLPEAIGEAAPVVGAAGSGLGSVVGSLSSVSAEPYSPSTTDSGGPGPDGQDPDILGATSGQIASVPVDAPQVILATGAGSGGGAASTPSPAIEPPADARLDTVAAGSASSADVSAPAVGDLSLGFLGQSYAELHHGDIGPLPDQGLLHGLV